MRPASAALPVPMPPKSAENFCSKAGMSSAMPIRQKTPPPSQRSVRSSSPRKLPLAAFSTPASVKPAFYPAIIASGPIFPLVSALA
jgi:hypothetical protein